MKRTLSFIMAIALLLCAAPVAIAADDDDFEYGIDYIWDDGYLLDEDEHYVDFNEPSDDTVPYGETVYYPLLSETVDSGGADYTAVHETKAAKNVKIKADWDEGKSYIDEIKVIRKRFLHGSELDDKGIDVSKSKYMYFLAITTRERSTSTTSTHEVYGDIFLKKTGDGKFGYDDGRELAVSFDVGYKESDDSNIIPETPALFRPGENFDEDSEEQFDFEADDDSYFIVNTNSQKKLVLGMDTDYDDDIGDMFPTADLYFFNGNGGHFNRLGYLHLYVGDDDYRYVYSIDDDGMMEKVNAEYDRYDECLIIRTRTLGRYVLSNIKLDVPDNTYRDDPNDVEVVYDNETGQNHNNPGTGGWGFDHIAYYGWPEPAAAAPVAPAKPVTNAGSGESEARQSAPAQTQDAEKPEKDEEKSKQDGELEITETAVNVEQARPSLSTMIIGEGDGDSAPDTRTMLMIACCVGAAASGIGLLLCIVAAINKNRDRYY